MIPHLEQGLTYDQACSAAGYDFKGHGAGERAFTLPAAAPEMEQITSPVVRRAVAQTIKVVNGIIREMAQRGCSVILLGDTLDECIGLSNRVLVMKDGLITGEFDAPAEHKPEHLDIIQCMM